MPTTPLDTPLQRNNDEPDQTTARTLGCHNVLDGCTGALLGGVIFPALTSAWILAEWGTGPNEDMGGPMPLPFLLIFAVIFGIAVGATAGTILGKIINRKYARRKQSEDRTKKD